MKKIKTNENKKGDFEVTIFYSQITRISYMLINIKPHFPWEVQQPNERECYFELANTFFGKFSKQS
jgi:hypothetical protein